MSTIARLLRAACTLFARIVRLVLPAGVASRRELVVLPNAIYVPGLFSAFATVLGSLEHYDNWRGRYAGMRIDFGTQGLYYDPSAGNNWWEYYFEPIHLEPALNAPGTIISADEHFYFARRVEAAMSRERGFTLIDRYIRPKPHIREKVDKYVRDNFNGAFMIGVHYRGTDKVEDAPRVPFKRVHAAILEAINVAGPVECVLFVATDEQAFLDYMLGQFPGQIHFLEMFRSIDGTPIDAIQGKNRKKGEDAVMDCLLLSRCDYLIRTASNLGLCASLFNPNVPVALLSREL